MQMASCCIGILFMKLNDKAVLAFQEHQCLLHIMFTNYLAIIPWARMGSELIAHEAEGQMGYWLRDHEGERNNCFSKI